MTLSPTTAPAGPLLLELANVDPRTLKLHKNVRIDPKVEADHEFLDSVSRRGVRTPIACYRGADGGLHGASQARGDVLAMGLILACYEDHLDVACWRTREAWVGRYLSFLESTGYELSDVERIAAGRLTVEEYEQADAQAAGRQATEQGALA